MFSFSNQGTKPSFPSKLNSVSIFQLKQHTRQKESCWRLTHQGQQQLDFLIKILVQIHFKGADPFIVQSREASGRCSVTYVFKLNSCLLLPQSLTMKATQSCLTLCNPMDYTVHGILQIRMDLYSPWNSPDQNTEMDSLSLLQGIFPTQGSNPGLLLTRWILYQLSRKGSPRIMEWVAYPFSRRSSQLRN